MRHSAWMVHLKSEAADRHLRV